MITFWCPADPFGSDRASSGLDDCTGFGRHICSAYGLGSLPDPKFAGAAASAQRADARSAFGHSTQLQVQQ